jgi:hypothetical protein
MQPLFTIHAGEFLVADHIERTFRKTHVWIPAKDTGVDLLVTDLRAKRCVSLQVKYSRDYLVTHLPSDYQSELRACGWWTFDSGKLERSPADYWVLLLVGFDNRTRDFVVLRPLELACRLRAIRSTEVRLQSYLWITKDRKCWETRGLPKSAQSEVVAGTYRDEQRDFTDCLNNWDPIAELNRDA